MCSYKAKLCGLLCSYIGITLAIAFALLEQATPTTTFTTTNTDTTTTTTGVTATGSIDDKPVTVPRITSSDSNKVFQKRNSLEHNLPDPFNKDVPSIIPSKPKPKLSNLKPIANIQNKETDCLVSQDNTENTSNNMDKINTCQNIPKEKFPAPHISPASVQFAMHSEQSTNVVGNFQSNTQ